MLRQKRNRPRSSPHLEDHVLEEVRHAVRLLALVATPAVDPHADGGGGYARVLAGHTNPRRGERGDLSARRLNCCRRRLVGDGGDGRRR